MLGKIILPLWIVAAFFMLLYSFTQVDLSLTLSQVSIWQSVQKAFQYIGYFERPLSTALFIVIIAMFFILYAATLRLILKNAIGRSLLVKIVLAVSVILFFSYNAFSYDLFNYIFDAKIFTYYGENPYEKKALDYPGDPMLSFMHWTHRTYPYGPVWLGLSIPLSYLGFGYFLVTFYLFKLIALFGFLTSVFFLEKIAHFFENDENKTLLPVAAFALNPLVLIESLVSAHNDIVMMAFGLLGIFFYLKRRFIKSLVFLLLSILLKFATALVIPAIMLRGIFGISKTKFFYVLTLSMIVAVILASYRTNFQSWYLIYAVPFASFLVGRYFVAIPLFVISLAGLLTYAPFLYLGNWGTPVPRILDYIIFGGIAVSLGLVCFYYILSRNKSG